MSRPLELAAAIVKGRALRGGIGHAGDGESVYLLEVPAGRSGFSTEHTFHVPCVESKLGRPGGVKQNSQGSIRAKADPLTTSILKRLNGSGVAPAGLAFPAKTNPSISPNRRCLHAQM